MECLKPKKKLNINSKPIDLDFLNDQFGEMSIKDSTQVNKVEKEIKEYKLYNQRICGSGILIWEENGNNGYDIILFQGKNGKYSDAGGKMEKNELYFSNKYNQLQIFQNSIKEMSEESYNMFMFDHSLLLYAKETEIHSYICFNLLLSGQYIDLQTFYNNQQIVFQHEYIPSQNAETCNVTKFDSAQLFKSLAPQKNQYQALVEDIYGVIQILDNRIILILNKLASQGIYQKRNGFLDLKAIQIKKIQNEYKNSENLYFFDKTQSYINY